MSVIDETDVVRGRLPVFPEKRDVGIGIVGAGFIVRDCHLVAYQQAGFRVVGITSRTVATAREVAALREVPKVFTNVESLIDDPEISVVDVAVPPLAQPDVIRRILNHPAHGIRAILAQKPLAMTLPEARALVEACDAAGVLLQVNQNMRYDQSVRALKTLLTANVLGTPVLATIDMRAIPHWMPWAEGGRSLATFIMSIHHLDCFRFWLGDPFRILASTRPDPRTASKFAHTDGLNLYILEFPNGARASSLGRCLGRTGARAARPKSASVGAWKVSRASRSARSAGPVGRRLFPARSTIPPSPTPARGTVPAGPKRGSPTPSPARWPGC